MRLHLLLSLLPLSLFSQVNIQKQADRVTVEINGKPFTALWTGADQRKPFLHPLLSATGKTVTRRWPMEQVEGEPKDHPHHRGLWFTHGDVNGIDFWGSDPSLKNDPKARIVVKSLDTVKSGKKEGTIGGIFEWTDKDGAVLLTENRKMMFYADADRRTIDFDITLTANMPVKFGDTKEGSFGLRLNPALQEDWKGGKATGTMVTAEGAAKEKNVWGKRSAWVDYAGELEGEKLGIAIFDHPGNPRHPTYWHSRAYGLFAANIFGLHDFYNDKSKDGSLQLEKGGTLRFRYRVIIHPGDAQSAGLAEGFRKYASKK